MTATTAFMGWDGELIVTKEVTYGTDPATGGNALVFISESLASRKTIIERDGIRGTRTHDADDSRQGIQTIGGQIMLEPTVGDLTFLLPLICGAVSGSGPYTVTLADTLPSFSVGIFRGIDYFTYSGCKVNSATFRGSKGGVISLALDIVGKSETLAAGSGWGTRFSAATAASLTNGPYTFCNDLALVLRSTTRELESFELTINNALVRDRFMNSRTVVNVPEGDRIVSLMSSFAWATANSDLYGSTLNDSELEGCTLTLTNDASQSTAFTFGQLQIPDNSPTIAGKGEVMLHVPFKVMGNVASSAKEVSIVHTP
jgi:hypothetical protein